LTGFKPFLKKFLEFLTVRVEIPTTKVAYYVEDLVCKISANSGGLKLS